MTFYDIKLTAAMLRSKIMIAMELLWPQYPFKNSFWNYVVVKVLRGGTFKKLLGYESCSQERIRVIRQQWGYFWNGLLIIVSSAGFSLSCYSLPFCDGPCSAPSSGLVTWSFPPPTRQSWVLCYSHAVWSQWMLFMLSLGVLLSSMQIYEQNKLLLLIIGQSMVSCYKRRKWTQTCHILI